MMTVMVADIKFYKTNDNGDPILTKDGKYTQLFQLKREVRFKPLEYLCEDMDENILEEISS